jgi:Fur family ferric uptake transcriptional regulator
MKRRRSHKREQILKVLKSARGSLSAADIHKKLSKIDLTTIYRNLDMFVKDGEAKKLNLGDGEAQYEYNDHDHHHAICLDCDKVIHFTAPDEKIMELLKVKGFKPELLEITLRGFCEH